MREMFLVAWCVGLLQSGAWAKAGPEIPLPKITLCEAIAKVQAIIPEEYGDSRADTAQIDFHQDCVVTMALYSDGYYRSRWSSFDPDPARDIKFDEYCWVITLTHRMHNDHSWTYQVKGDGSLRLLESSR